MHNRAGMTPLSGEAVKGVVGKQVINHRLVLMGGREKNMLAGDGRPGLAQANWLSRQPDKRAR